MSRLAWQAGFNLVELMIALAILAVGMAGFGAMLAASYSSDRYNATMRRAESAGTKLIEKFRSGNGGSTAASDPCEKPLPPSGKTAYTMERCIDVTKTAGKFYLTWTTTNDPSGVNILDVVVAWDGPQCTYGDPTKCARRVRMSTIYK